MSAAAKSSLPRVFIDGQSGTVGLRIRSMLAGREDVVLVEVDESRRRDPSARQECLHAADVAVLCLPDDAAREAANLVEGTSTRLLDGSSAHRVSEGWVYGMPELSSQQRDVIAKASRVSNPGCWPTGVVLLLRPLVDAGLIPSDMPLTIHGVSGYSGGGKDMIGRWQDAKGPLPTLPFSAPYATEKRHKHLPEMSHYAGLAQAPQFVPAVGAFECGMRVQIPLHRALLPSGTDGRAMLESLATRYEDEPAVVVRKPAEVWAGGELALDPRRCNGHNRVELTALPHPDGHVLLVAVLDNLGKGAAGAAVQNLNLMLGLPEWSGLTLQ